MNKLLATLALVAVTGSTQAMAQAGPGGGGWQQDMTRQQAQQRADSMFQRLDTNHDGTVTLQEAQQAAAQMGGGNGGDRAQRMIQRMFAGAQSVTLQQFEAQSLARFDAMDTNHDGTVTVDERQQARAARGGGQGRSERG